MRYHPSKGPFTTYAGVEFNNLKQAYSILANEVTREAYDAYAYTPHHLLVMWFDRMESELFPTEDMSEGNEFELESNIPCLLGVYIEKEFFFQVNTWSQRTVKGLEFEARLKEFVCNTSATPPLIQLCLTIHFQLVGSRPVLPLQPWSQSLRMRSASFNDAKRFDWTTGSV